MIVIVAEKPSVARSIARVVGATDKKTGYIEGNGYQVTWCYGHIVELYDAQEYDESYKKWSEDDLPIIPRPFKIKVKEDKKEQFNVIKSLFDDADEIIEATDAEREGELIFRLVYKMSGCRKPFKRLWISSLEDSAIREGLDNLKDGSEYDDLYDAARSRQEADWLFGINLSRFYTCRYKNKLTTGRVQTPTLNMIVKRFLEIQNFKPVPYYIVTADNGDYKVKRREDERSDADRVMKECANATGRVKKVEKTKKTEKAPTLYDLTTLQRDANRILGLSAKETLDIAQALYEKQLVTYPRTNCCYIPSDMKDSTEDVLNKLIERGLFKKVPNIESYDIDVSRTVNDKKAQDESHPALIPTENVTLKVLGELDQDAQNILALIVWRLLIASGSPYIYESTKVIVDIKGYDFTCDGRTVIDGGFKIFLDAMDEDADPDEKKKEKDDIVPDVSEGDPYQVEKIDLDQKFTKPPAHYTEDTLLQQMETCGKKIDDEELRDAMKEKGLGTPATRAGIIENLITTGYVERSKKKLIPTEKGITFISLVTDKIKSPDLTAEWEYNLSLVQHGELDREVFMEDIEDFLKTFIPDERKKPVKNADAFVPVFGKCPHCGGDVLKGKYGLYCKSKCGMIFSRIRKVELTDSQWKKLLDGQKVLMKGLVSEKTGKTYDAYFVPAGIREFESEKDGETVTRYALNVDLEFPDKNNKKK